MDISIVIINWNTVDMTRECLQTVFAETSDVSAEVILVDNNSTDGSADMVAREFPEAILIRNSENRGFAAANNQGFEIARGRTILMLNSDTLVHGDVIQKSVAFLDTHAEVGAMGCRVLNTDGTMQQTCQMYPSVLNQFLLASGLWKLKFPRFLGRYRMTHWLRDSDREVEDITGCYLLLRREVLEQIGPLDESFFFYGEETDWCKRMRDAGWKLMFSPVGEITHHGGASAKKLNYKRDVLLARSKIKLHKKHNGSLSAAAVWLIAIFFNCSRTVFWNLKGAFTRKDDARERGTHFANVSKDLISKGLGD